MLPALLRNRRRFLARADIREFWRAWGRATIARSSSCLVRVCAESEQGTAGQAIVQQSNSAIIGRVVKPGMSKGCKQVFYRDPGVMRELDGGVCREVSWNRSYKSLSTGVFVLLCLPYCAA
jgi:hypothetical protein